MRTTRTKAVLDDQITRESLGIDSPEVASLRKETLHLRRAFDGIAKKNSEFKAVLDKVTCQQHKNSPVVLYELFKQFDAYQSVDEIKRDFDALTGKWQTDCKEVQFGEVLINGGRLLLDIYREHFIEALYRKQSIAKMNIAPIEIAKESKDPSQSYLDKMREMAELTIKKWRDKPFKQYMAFQGNAVSGLKPNDLRRAVAELNAHIEWHKMEVLKASEEKLSIPLSKDVASLKAESARLNKLNRYRERTLDQESLKLCNSREVLTDAVNQLWEAYLADLDADEINHLKQITTLEINEKTLFEELKKSSELEAPAMLSALETRSKAIDEEYRKKLAILDGRKETLRLFNTQWEFNVDRTEDLGSMTRDTHFNQSDSKSSSVTSRSASPPLAQPKTKASMIYKSGRLLVKGFKAVGRAVMKKKETNGSDDVRSISSSVSSSSTSVTDDTGLSEMLGAINQSGRYLSGRYEEHIKSLDSNVGAEKLSNHKQIDQIKELILERQKKILKDINELVNVTLANVKHQAIKERAEECKNYKESQALHVDIDWVALDELEALKLSILEAINDLKKVIDDNVTGVLAPLFGKLSEMKAAPESSFEEVMNKQAKLSDLSAMFEKHANEWGGMHRYNSIPLPFRLFYSKMMKESDRLKTVYKELYSKVSPEKAKAEEALKFKEKYEKICVFEFKKGDDVTYRAKFKEVCQLLKEAEENHYPFTYELDGYLNKFKKEHTAIWKDRISSDCKAFEETIMRRVDEVIESKTDVASRLKSIAIEINEVRIEQRNKIDIACGHIALSCGPVRYLNSQYEALQACVALKMRAPKVENAPRHVSVVK